MVLFSFFPILSFSSEKIQNIYIYTYIYIFNEMENLAITFLHLLRRLNIVYNWLLLFSGLKSIFLGMIVVSVCSVCWKNDLMLIQMV